jgi:hypothetical protein
MVASVLSREDLPVRSTSALKCTAAELSPSLANACNQDCVSVDNVSLREMSVGANTTKLQSKKHSCDLEVSVSLTRIPVKQPKRAAQSKATVELSSERTIEVAKRKRTSDEPAKSPAKAPKSATFNSKRNVAVKTSRNENRPPFEYTRPFAQAAMWRRSRQLAEAEEAKAAALAASNRLREASVCKQNVGGENREASPSAELPTLDERIAAILGEAPPDKRDNPPQSSSKPTIPSLLDVVIPPLPSKRLLLPLSRLPQRTPRRSHGCHVGSFNRWFSLLPLKRLILTLNGFEYQHDGSLGWISREPRSKAKETTTTQ